MRVLVDECCPRIVAETLTAEGFDVVSVAQGSPGATDDALVIQAEQDDRVIVTQDYDFGEIAVRQGRSGAGVVIIACQSLPPLERASRTAMIMTQLAEGLYGHLTIIEVRRVRQRLIVPR